MCIGFVRGCFVHVDAKQSLAKRLLLSGEFGPPQESKRVDKMGHPRGAQPSPKRTRGIQKTIPLGFGKWQRRVPKSDNRAPKIGLYFLPRIRA